MADLKFKILGICLPDLIELVAFARLLGWGALVAVLALVGNAMTLAAQERVRDHAVLQTLGYPNGLIARLLLAESTLVSVVGGSVGLLGSVALLRWGAISLFSEGLALTPDLSLSTIGTGFALCCGLGLLAGLVPGLRAARSEAAACLRAM